MKKKLAVIALVVAVLALGAYGFTKLPSADTNTSSSATPTQKAIVFADVQKEVADGSAMLYDVRTSDEYATGHFANAQNFPLQSMQVGQFPKVEKTKKIYVYCHSGNRSSQATTLLKNAGFTQVVDLHGITDVQAIGGTLQTN